MVVDRKFAYLADGKVYRTRHEVEHGLEWGSYERSERDGVPVLIIDLDGIPCVSMPEWGERKDVDEWTHGSVAIQRDPEAKK